MTCFSVGLCGCELRWLVYGSVLGRVLCLCGFGLLMPLCVCLCVLPVDVLVILHAFFMGLLACMFVLNKREKCVLLSSSFPFL